MGDTTQQQPAMTAPPAATPASPVAQQGMTQQQKMQLIAQLLPQQSSAMMQALALRAKQQPQLPPGTPDGSAPPLQ